MPEVVIVDSKGVEHVFPDGFDPKRAAALVRQQATPSQPDIKPASAVDMALADNPALPPQLRAMSAILRLAKAHPVATGATVGGLMAAPLTGGASLGALAASGLGAAGGAGAAIAGRQLATGKPEPAAETLKTMATEGALGAAGEGIGRVASTALKLAGRGAYRVALAPIQKTLGKYGDVVGEGLETATPVSKAGLEKAAGTKAARMATKKAALAEADTRAAFKASDISHDAAHQLSDYATKQVRAGLPDPTPEFTERIAQFEAANPNGTLRPSSLDEIKATIDDTLGGAYRKMRGREPITGTEKAGMEMSKAMSRANEAVVPRYREMNRGIMDAEGLRQAIQRRTLGSGGNQILDTLLMFMRGTAGIPGRVAMMPEILSRGGIGAYKAAPAAPITLKSAILAALSPDAPEN